jgi:hypothetical protein
MDDTIKNVAGTSILGGIGAKIWQQFNKSRSKKR